MRTNEVIFYPFSVQRLIKCCSYDGLESIFLFRDGLRPFLPFDIGVEGKLTRRNNKS
jgi:hypothetical protein